MTAATPAPRLDGYQRRLVLFLSVATFFEGYDFLALAQILPTLRAAFQLTTGEAGLLVGFVNTGTIAAYGLVRLADRLGRRRVLQITIAGYTLASLATAASPGLYGFAAAQFASRAFLIGEWAVAMVYAAEEFPAARRGMIIGVIQAAASLGAVVCAGTVPLLLGTPLGWRAVFVVGAVPLLLVAWARRGVRETARFAAVHKEAAPAPLGRILATPHARRVVELAAIWALTYACSQTAITFWKEFAVSERGLSDKQVGGMVAIAAVGAMPFVFLAGRLLDVIGRRRGAVLYYAITALGVIGAYQLSSRAALTVALALQIFGAASVLPLLNTYTAELFPTELRADGFAWANNLLGRLGFVLGPVAVGYLAGATTWSTAVTATTGCLALALLLILWRLPETGGRELEETARV